MEKYFIITVDTEGDNLWEPVIRPNGMRHITVKNAAYIERFQKTCEKYHFIPTYLVNYEMAKAEPFAGMAREWVKDKKCEIGMHMHAWNTPPVYELQYRRGSNNPYAGEYPRKVLWAKLKGMTELLQEQFGVKPVSHRGGRWYIDAWYIQALEKLGYTADCSATPGVSWKNHIGYGRGGRDYRKFPQKVYRLDNRHIFREGNSRILEVPPTITSLPAGRRVKDILCRPHAYREIMSKKIWLRPNGNNLQDMIGIVEQYEKSECDYLEFMIHSSELMPGGSPTFLSRSSIENMYSHLEAVFERAESTYKGSSLSSYAEGK